MSKRLRLFFAAGYTAALLACFICNLVIFHTLDWFWIVPTAVMTVFCLTNLPALAGKNRLPVCLGAATGSLALLLAVRRGPVGARHYGGMPGPSLELVGHLAVLRQIRSFPVHGGLRCAGCREGPGGQEEEAVGARSSGSVC